MGRVVRNGRRRVAVALGAVLVAVMVVVAPAWGATTTTTCANFAMTLSHANPGDTIELTELCQGSNNSFSLSGAPSNLTIEGAAAGDGFDGSMGASGPALNGVAPAGLTLRNLTFEHYSLTDAPAVQLVLSTGALPVIDHDSFMNNTDSSVGVPAGGGLELFGESTSCAYTGSLTISNSLFSGNALETTDTGNTTFSGITGGGASVSTDCSSGTASLVITGNTFRQNSIQSAGPTAVGGGLYVANSDVAELTGTQSGNVFADNSIVNNGTTPSTFGGAGEWLASVNLTSTSDTYTGNTLPAPGTGFASEGAGLGTVRSNCASGSPITGTATASATNLVAAGNAIGAASGTGQVEGAGVYAGCTATIGTGDGFHLTLINSTVAGNSGPGGAAGVDGETGDTLTLQNSIVAANTGAGATDVGGFGATPGANVTATNSDACAIGSTTAPFAGTGNICANPTLAGAATGDVHETAASPTIDAGSNTFVPSGVTTDAFGQPRIVATKQAQPIVDIGAAEFQTAFVPPNPTPNPPKPTPPKPPVAHVTKEKVTKSGVDVTIHCSGTTAQRCSGKVSLTTVETRLGIKVIAVSAAVHKPKRRHVTTGVGSAAYRVAGGRTITVHVTLNRTGKRLLTEFRKLPVRVTVTQSGKTKAISTRTQTIRAPKPKAKPKKPKP
jgi:hypothetical protein